METSEEADADGYPANRWTTDPMAPCSTGLFAPLFSLSQLIAGDNETHYNGLFGAMRSHRHGCHGIKVASVLGAANGLGVLALIGAQRSTSRQ